MPCQTNKAIGRALQISVCAPIPSQSDCWLDSGLRGRFFFAHYLNTVTFMSSTLITILTPRGRKIRSIKDQQGKYYFCYTDVCHALSIDPHKAFGKIGSCPHIVSMPVKVHKQKPSTRFISAEGLPVLGKAMDKPEALQMLEYLRQKTEKPSVEMQRINDVVLECLPVVRLMVELRKFRDCVADTYHSIYGKDKDMEEAKDYISAQEHIAEAINDLSKITGDIMSEYVNYC